MMNWSEWEDEDRRYERCYWRRVGFVIFAAACLAVILLPVMGCATARDAEVCFMRIMGQTEDGTTVVAQQCMTPEAFAESQK